MNSNVRIVSINLVEITIGMSTLMFCLTPNKKGRLMPKRIASFGYDSAPSRSEEYSARKQAAAVLKKQLETFREEKKKAEAVFNQLSN